MKLTSKKLKRIIKEEMAKLIEMGMPHYDESGYLHGTPENEEESEAWNAEFEDSQMPPAKEIHGRSHGLELPSEMSNPNLSDDQIDAIIARLQASKTGM